MNEDIQIRPLEASDQSFLAKMAYEAGYAASKTAITLDEALELGTVRELYENWGQPTDIGLIAQDGAGRPLGVAWSRITSGRINDGAPASEQEVYVALEADARGKKIGKRLFQALLDEVTDEGIGEVSLYVYADNTVAVDLYEQFGFEIDETLHNKHGQLYFRMSRHTQ
jgi:ribosomal protein S18 acetylase RimI-like enzyme